MSLDARRTIEELREAIRHIERRLPARGAFVPTGWERVDALLPGRGLPRGALAELTGGRACGKTAVALSALARAVEREGALGAYVDGRHELYPPAAAASGIPLDRLLVVRPSDRDPIVACKSGLWAAEALLASGAFEGVVIDVPVEVLVRHAPSAIDGLLRRVRGAAEKGGAMGVWLGVPGGPRVSPSFRLEFAIDDTGWHVQRVRAPMTDDLGVDRPTPTTIHAA